MATLITVLKNSELLTIITLTEDGKVATLPQRGNWPHLRLLTRWQGVHYRYSYRRWQGGHTSSGWPLSHCYKKELLKERATLITIECDDYRRRLEGNSQLL